MILTCLLRRLGIMVWTEAEIVAELTAMKHKVLLQDPPRPVPVGITPVAGPDMPVIDIDHIIRSEK